MDRQGIELIGVTKTYRALDSEITALRDIDLSIHIGEYVGLIGANGSGKSTLARLINGLIKPTEGRVKVNGFDTSSLDDVLNIRRLVGMVFQNPDNQLICPIVEEEIAFGLENLELSVSEINDRIDWALQTVGLSEMRYHSPHLLSAGQKQKVALASVLAMKPDYLVLDEPMSMLDPFSRWELLEQLRKLNSQNGTTILISSHDPEDLFQVDRLIVIHEGAVVIEGTPREVYAQEEKLADIGIEVPTINQIFNQLSKDGHRIPDGIRNIPDLVESICRK